MIEAVKDVKKDIEFWLNALSNDKLDQKSVSLLNQCLQAELNNYINPFVAIKGELKGIDKYMIDKLNKDLYAYFNGDIKSFK